MSATKKIIIALVAGFACGFRLYQRRGTGVQIVPSLIYLNKGD